MLGIAPMSACQPLERQNMLDPESKFLDLDLPGIAVIVAQGKQTPPPSPSPQPASCSECHQSNVQMKEKAGTKKRNAA